MLLRNKPILAIPFFWILLALPSAAAVLRGTAVRDVAQAVHSSRALAPTSVVPAFEYMPDNLCVQTNPNRQTYYVATNGLDSNPGSSAAPFGTLAKGVSVLQAGDTLIVRAGTYSPVADMYKNLDIIKTGTATNYIVIKGEGRPVINVSSMNGVQIWNSQYVELRGFEVRGVNDPSPINPNDTNQNGNGISVFGNTGNKFIRVIDNWVHHVGGNGIGVGSSDQVLIAGNTIWHVAHRSYAGNSGIAITGPKDFFWTNNYGTVVAENLVYDVENRYPCSCYGYQQITDGNGIIFDYYLNADRNTYSKRMLAVNNVVHSNGGRGIHTFNFHDVDIMFNTAYGNLKTPVLANGYNGEYAITQSAGVRVYNNVAQATNTQWALTFLAATNQGEAKYNVLHGNVYDNNLGAAVSNNLNSDPLFVNANFGTNYAAADLSLQAGSPAIDYATSTFGTFPVDFSGQSRPSGAKDDVGAFEFMGPTAPEPTKGPTSTPSASPTDSPVPDPTSSPSTSPTANPTSSPSISPTAGPTSSPMTEPPTVAPTASPTNTPTISPTANPTNSPVLSTESPTVSPTGSPNIKPTVSPSSSPTAGPTTSPVTPSPTTPAPVPSPTGAFEYLPDAVVVQSGTGKTYYVKPNGNDYLSGLSIANAFSTLKKGVSVLNAGDTLLVLDGTYNEWDGTKNLYVSKHGSPTDWIVIAAYPGASPKIQVSTNNGVEIMSSRYLEFRGFEVTGQGSWSHHGISVYKGWNGNSAFVRVVDNTIHHVGSHGIAASSTDQLFIGRNTIYSCTGNSWQAGIHLSNLADVHPTSHLYGVVLAENTIYDNVNWNGGEGILLGWSNGGYSKHTLVVNNIIYGNGARGIFLNQFHKATIIQNTLYGNLQNNNYKWYGEIMAQSGSLNVDVKGNVLDSTTASYSIMNAFGTSGTIDFNVMNGASNAQDPIQEDGSTVGSSNVLADPLLVNPSGGNFALSSGSPAVDAGSSAEITTILVDHAGSPRPKGAAADAGALESA